MLDRVFDKWTSDQIVMEVNSYYNYNTTLYDRICCIIIIYFAARSTGPRHGREHRRRPDSVLWRIQGGQNASRTGRHADDMRAAGRTWHPTDAAVRGEFLRITLLFPLYLSFVLHKNA